MGGTHRWVRGGMRFLCSVLCALLIVGCGEKGGAGAGGRPGGDAGPVRIAVSIAPLRGVVEELARELGPDVQIDLVVPVGALEHGFEVPPSTVQKLAQADLVVYVGLGLEPQVEQVLEEKRAWRREVCFADVVGIQGDGHHDHDHDHGHDHEGHEHEHGETCDHGHGVDPHLWLDPSLMAKLVPALAEALAQTAEGLGRTEAAASLRATDGPAARLASRVADVDAAYEEALRPHRGAVMITAHAAWGRLAERYGLEQAPLAGLEANEPSTAAIAKATELVQSRNVRAVFSEPQVNKAVVERVATAAGARVYELDPLGDGDWFAMMTRNLEALKAGLGAGG